MNAAASWTPCTPGNLRAPLLETLDEARGRVLAEAGSSNRARGPPTTGSRGPIAAEIRRRVTKTHCIAWCRCLKGITVPPVRDSAASDHRRRRSRTSAGQRGTRPRRRSGGRRFDPAAFRDLGVKGRGRDATLSQERLLRRVKATLLPSALRDERSAHHRRRPAVACRHRPSSAGLRMRVIPPRATPVLKADAAPGSESSRLSLEGSPLTMG